MNARAWTYTVGAVVALSGCSGRSDAPPAPTPVATPEAEQPEAREPEAPPPPLPRRPFQAGDVLDAPEITVEGTEAGDAVFGYPARGAADHLNVPLPRGCTVAKRARSAIALVCPGAYSAVFAFYTRLTEPYAVGRRRFGGQFDEYGRVGIYRADARQTLVIDVAQGEHAALGIRSGGVPLRVRGEPEGSAGTDPPLPETADAKARLLRAYGAYRCGDEPILVGVRGLVFNRDRDSEAECRRLRLEPAGSGGAVRVVCGELTGSSERLGARAQTYRSTGLVLRAVGADVELDGQRCAADVGR